LAFYTKDIEQIHRLFSKSGLYREKWDREEYKRKTITKALEGSVDAKENLESPINTKEKLEVSNQETASIEPYVITEDRIYLNVLDSKGHHMFAYLGDSGKIEYSESVQVDGRTVFPQELPSSSNGKRLITVGIPLKESIDCSHTMGAEELFEVIKNHIKKYVDAPELEIEMFAYYILFTWYYKKVNTVPYLRYLGDTGKGKSRMLRVIIDLCFYPINAGGGSSTSGIMRFNQLWHGTLGLDELDIAGGMEHDLIKYLNLGFEAGNFFLKTNSSDFSKQEWFDPFCPKVIAMRKPFKDNATEGRLLSFTPRETTRQDIPMNLPPNLYEKEVEKIRALIARFVLSNWVTVDESKLLSCNDIHIEPRLKQLVIPMSLVLQLLPNGEERFKNYMQCRQEEVTKIRSESWEGMIFNCVWSLAIGNEIPLGKSEKFFVEGKVVAVTPLMVAEILGTSAKNVTQALMTIGFTTEMKYVNVPNESNKNTRTRMYVVPSAVAWREMVQRYLERDSESEEAVKNIPECPDVLKATKFMN
jgi:hypothetical protein